MNDGREPPPPLRPLWMLAGGAVVSAAAAAILVEPAPPWAPTALTAAGLAAAVAAILRPPGGGPLLWFAAALALVGGRGLVLADDRLGLARLMADPAVTLRVRAVVDEGWTAGRWGSSARIRVLAANHDGRRVGLPTHCRLEVRSGAVAAELPPPGAEVEALARPRGEPARPLLVVDSPRLLASPGAVRLLPLARDRLARALLGAAGTDVDRIRAAELAAALALGRRDLIPRERREHWRRSGFAHLLAVSGLHVGIVGGAIFLIVALGGAGPRLTRLLALLAVPGYALLAGSAPPAMRAALMAVIFLGARLLGRAVLPMAAVLLAVLILLLADPRMISDVGFQLTVVITAALVRWVPPLAAALRGPTWLAAAVAVPLVAQLAAVPIVAWHFRSLIPGALAANLLALPLLAPTVLVAAATALLAPVATGTAGLGLEVLHRLSALLSWLGGWARGLELVPASLPLLAAPLLAVCGWLALQSGRTARAAAAVWVALALLLGVRSLAPADRPAPRVAVLPVSDGAAVLLADAGAAVLVDAGRYPRQAAESLADQGVRRLAAVVASHTDEDHIGGMVQVLESCEVGRLIVPAQMTADAEAVPLLRAARRRSVAVVPVAAGSVVHAGSLRIEVLWPPARNPPADDNERSLVILADLGPGAVVAAADISHSTERHLPAGGRLHCELLVVPHHGSRGSVSEHLLDATSPAIALIPAAAGNTHGHPHPEVVSRLAGRGIVIRRPTRDAACGAAWNGSRWVAFP
jgi:competence protein ComEC